MYVKDWFSFGHKKTSWNDKEDCPFFSNHKTFQQTTLQQNRPHTKGNSKILGLICCK